MADFEEFAVGLSDSEVTEPMMQIPSVLPALPLRDIVIYPFMIVPLFVSRDKEALKENRMIVLVSQKDLNKEDPGKEDLFETGTVAIIMRMLKLPDGRIRILIQGLSRSRVESIDPSGDHDHAGRGLASWMAPRAPITPPPMRIRRRLMPSTVPPQRPLF